ncbi:Mannosyltransferase [Aphelenchoides fujianensis]|nr:Mannosyltransferase [Aphelenchoides fujianensis]
MTKASAQHVAESRCSCGLDWLDRPRFVWLLLFRLANLALVRTWFGPDEHFQSVEVAYEKVFGVGHLSWEWRPEFALRSFLHPLLFMVLYAPLKLLGLDSGVLVRLLPEPPPRGPRDQTVARSAFLLYLSNWFVWFCAPRTLSNSLETVLTIVGLHFYPLEMSRVHVLEKKHPGFPFVGYSVCAALACLIRPTSALIWVPLAAVHLYRSKKQRTRLLVQHHLPPAVVVAAFSVVLDSTIYGRFTIPAWNFVEFNALRGGSANFGVNPPYWYLSEGLPPVFTLSIVPLVLAVWELFFMNGPPPSKHRRQFTSVQSAAGDRRLEHRFLLPVIPLLLPYVASYVNRLERFNTLALWLIVLLQVPLCGYFGLFHQKAPGEMVDFVNEELKERALGPATIAHLMPCYSMPQYAAIHPYGVLGTKIIALDCSPNLNGVRFSCPCFQSILFAFRRCCPGRTRDESELFHFDPLNFVRTRWAEIGQSNFIFVYERVFKKLEAFLVRSKGFEVARTFYNTRFPVGDNQDPLVYASSTEDGDLTPVPLTSFFSLPPDCSPLPVCNQSDLRANCHDLN